MATRQCAQDRRSLMELYPRQAIVPIALLLCTGLLIAGLSLPILHAQQMIFWKSSYSVWRGIASLWEQQERGLAVVVFFFSIVFPFAKLLLLTLVWFVRLTGTQRVRLLHWLGLLGKWSMLDVFAVAILIVLVKLGPLANVEPRLGVYIFAAAILSSMFTTMYVEYLASKALPTR